MKEDFAVYSWVWTPNGPLQDDPAPEKNVEHIYSYTGGPIQATATGAARARGSAQFSILLLPQILAPSLER